jgi:hypothetical protein
MWYNPVEIKSPEDLPRKEISITPLEDGYRTSKKKMDITIPLVSEWVTTQSLNRQEKSEKIASPMVLSARLEKTA